MSCELVVTVQSDLLGGVKIQFTREDSPLPFNVAEWPDIRESLREEIRPDIPEDEFESYLQSYRTGESYVYRIGTITVSEDGTIQSKDYDASIESLKEAFREQPENE